MATKIIDKVKDLQALSLASSALDATIIKATAANKDPPKNKHIRQLVHYTKESTCSIKLFIQAISPRLRHEKWTVVVKALIVLHRIYQDGDGMKLCPFNKFRQQVAGLKHYYDSVSISGHMGSTFVKLYGSYVAERMGVQRDTKIRYDKDHSILQKMSPKHLLQHLPRVLGLLERLLACKISGEAQKTILILHTFPYLFKDAFNLYKTFSNGILNLLDCLFQMEPEDAKVGLKMYKGLERVTTTLNNMRAAFEHLLSGLPPPLKPIPPEVMASIEDFVNEKKSRPSRSRSTTIEDEVDDQLRSPSPRRKSKKKAPVQNSSSSDESEEEDFSGDESEAAAKWAATPSPYLISFDDQHGFVPPSYNTGLAHTLSQALEFSNNQVPDSPALARVIYAPPPGQDDSLPCSPLVGRSPAMASRSSMYPTLPGYASPQHTGLHSSSAASPFDSPLSPALAKRRAGGGASGVGSPSMPLNYKHFDSEKSTPTASPLVAGSLSAHLHGGQQQMTPEAQHQAYAAAAYQQQQLQLQQLQQLQAFQLQQQIQLQQMQQREQQELAAAMASPATSSRAGYMPGYHSTMPMQQPLHQGSYNYLAGGIGGFDPYSHPFLPQAPGSQGFPGHDESSPFGSSTTSATNTSYGAPLRSSSGGLSVCCFCCLLFVVR
eukprot:TRINITY_DN1485_c1_g2_i2.p1 TRINITY_DN1485_c1_g2~~TRINITY_DN1485_c1_g2_i2.p1  ORF type:complete len:660 (+),score=107.09 TRINITY_DN1485_c1_g2_i2:86-2065(+)